MMSKFQAGEQPLLASLLGVVLRSAALNGREEDVSLVVDEMARLGCTSVSDTYTAVLEGSLKAKKKNRVEPLITVMNMEGCAPTTATIDVLLRAALEANDAEAILSACRIQEEHKVIASYQVLEDAYAAARDLGHPLACNRLYEAKEAHRAVHAQLVAESSKPLPVVHKPRDRFDEGGRDSSGEGGWENRRRYGGLRRDAEGREKREEGGERAGGKERGEGAQEAAGSEGREQRRGWERRGGKEGGAESSSNDSTGYRRSNNNNYNNNNNNNKNFNGGYRTSSYNGRAIERFGAGGYATPAAAEGSSVGVRSERRERGE
uniref:Pentacotripeptide-repeat region of PRORP domain-containing protein n=1 Tax=Polytomella parva TaxID=51329 RepID=A0A7S0UNA9_9CHLO